MISVHCQGKPLNITVIQVYDLTTDAEEAEVEQFYITVIQLYAPTTDAEEAEVERFYEDLQDFIEIMPKICPF